MNDALIKEWMSKKGVSPEGLADMLKISFYTVRKMLRGERVSDPIVELLSIKTGISSDKLTSIKPTQPKVKGG